MKDRYPRTVGEYVEAAGMVVIECGRCRRKGPLDLSMLEVAFGADFDMYSSMREMRDRLCWPKFGSGRNRRRRRPTCPLAGIPGGC